MRAPIQVLPCLALMRLEPCAPQAIPLLKPGGSVVPGQTEKTAGEKAPTSDSNDRKAHSDRESRISLLMAEHPTTSKAACEGCVAKEEDLIAKEALLVAAHVQKALKDTALIAATAAHDQCTSEENSAIVATETAKQICLTRVTTLNTAITTDDAAGAELQAGECSTGADLKPLMTAWLVSTNAQAAKVAECITLMGNKTEKAGVIPRTT
jgi:hypothetical protein